MLQKWKGTSLGENSCKNNLTEKLYLEYTKNAYNLITELILSNYAQLKNGQKTWTNTSTKGTCSWQTGTEKCSASWVIRDMQIKATIRFTTHTLIWLKLKRLTIPSVGQNVEQLEVYYIVRGDVKL